MIVALINYYFLNEQKKKMMIELFKVFKPFRNNGLGKQIIAKFCKIIMEEKYI